MKKAKIRLNALWLLGIIYTILGGAFVLMGLVTALVTGDSDARLVGGIFAGIGSIFLVLGIMFLAIEIRKLRRANQLLEAGRFLWAEVIDCMPNYNVRINGRHPYTVVVRYVDGRGTVHLFKSGSLRMYVDPSAFGKQVKVYYEDESYKHYYVDVDSILQNVVEH